MINKKIIYFLILILLIGFTWQKLWSQISQFQKTEKNPLITLPQEENRNDYLTSLKKKLDLNPDQMLAIGQAVDLYHQKIKNSQTAEQYQSLLSDFNKKIKNILTEEQKEKLTRLWIGEEEFFPSPSFIEPPSFKEELPPPPKKEKEFLPYPDHLMPPPPGSGISPLEMNKGLTFGLFALIQKGPLELNDGRRKVYEEAFAVYVQRMVKIEKSLTQKRSVVLANSEKEILSVLDDNQKKKYFGFKSFWLQGVLGLYLISSPPPYLGLFINHRLSEQDFLYYLSKELDLNLQQVALVGEISKKEMKLLTDIYNEYLDYWHQQAQDFQDKIGTVLTNEEKKEFRDNIMKREAEYKRRLQKYDNQYREYIQQHLYDCTSVEEIRKVVLYNPLNPTNKGGPGPTE